jgi:hypothetical protein
MRQDVCKAKRESFVTKRGDLSPKKKHNHESKEQEKKKMSSITSQKGNPGYLFTLRNASLSGQSGR